MKKLVTICIPTYKQTQYLKKCLDSILIQNFKNFELIISDDTPDNSVELFVKEALKDFELTNYAFSKLREQPNVDERIVLVNIGNLTRRELAQEIQAISQYKPRVIGRRRRPTPRPRSPNRAG